MEGFLTCGWLAVVACCRVVCLAGEEEVDGLRVAVPEQWPLPFSYSSWATEIPGGTLERGHYEIRARTVDVAGNAQPQPRPYHKNGRNTIGTRRVQVV